MARPRQEKASAFRQVPGLAPMLVAGLLAKSGATMVGLAMGFVAYQQTESAFVVAVVAAAFGLGFAASSLSPDTSSSAPACARCSSAR